MGCRSIKREPFPHQSNVVLDCIFCLVCSCFWQYLVSSSSRLCELMLDCSITESIGSNGLESSTTTSHYATNSKFEFCHCWLCNSFIIHHQPNYPSWTASPVWAQQLQTQIASVQQAYVNQIYQLQQALTQPNMNWAQIQGYQQQIAAIQNQMNNYMQSLMARRV